MRKKRTASFCDIQNIDILILIASACFLGHTEHNKRTTRTFSFDTSNQTNRELVCKPHRGEMKKNADMN